MQITFDTTTITDDEVRGIFALLDMVRPVEEPEWTGVKITKNEEVSREPVEDTADKGWVAGPSDGNLTFDGEEFPQSPVPPTTDSTGLPWHPDIHASSKALNADGTWRTKRGVDKALVARVEAELRQSDVDNADYSDEVTEIVSVAPPAPPAPEAPTAPLVSAPTPAAPSPEPAAPVAESVPTPPAGVSPFVALMKRVTTAQGSGKLTAQRVKELLESLDKKSIMDLRTDTDALDAFAVLLDGEGV